MTESYQLENDALLAVFDDAGALRRLLAKVSGREWQGRDELARCFEMVAPLPERLLNTICGDKQDKPTIAQDGDRLTFVWESLVSESGGRLDVGVEATVVLTDLGLQFGMAIDNRSRYPVETVAYPYIGDVSRPGKGRTLKRSSFTYCSLSHKSLWPAFDNERGYWGVEWPIQMVPAPDHPFMLMQHEGDGLYVGYHDVEARERVEYTFMLKPGHGKMGYAPEAETVGGEPVRLEFQTLHLPMVQPGEACSLAPIVVMPFEGDWHAGADIYRRWRETWMRPAARPEWLEELHAWQQIQMTSWGDSLRIRYDELVDYARQCVEHGVKAIQLTGWTLYGQDGRLPIHEIDERLGTKEEFKAALAAIKAMGLKVLLYEKYTCVDKGTDWYDEELHHYTSKDVFGNTHGHEGWRYDTPAHLAGVNTRPYAWMCMNSEEWQDVAVEQIRRSLELGGDGVLLDESMWHGSNAFYCYDETHGHRVPAFNFAGDAPFERKALAALAEKGEAMILAGEGPYDFQNRHYHLSYHRTLPGHIPAVRYIDPYLPMMSWAVGYDDRENINYCLLYRYMISYEPRHFRGALEDFPRTLEYGKKVDALRRRYREWLWDAEFRDTLGAAVESDGGEVLYSVFRREDDAVAVVVVNHHDKAVSVRVRRDDGAAVFVVASPEQPEPRDVRGSVETESRSALVFMESK